MYFIIVVNFRCFFWYLTRKEIRNIHPYCNFVDVDIAVVVFAVVVVVAVDDVVVAAVVVDLFNVLL